jgi:hypothetical protein
MMKGSNEYAQRLQRLCSRLPRELGVVKEPEKTDPLTELVLACLAAPGSETRARAALNRLRGQFVDFNELRVARVDEVADVLGRQYGPSKEVGLQLLNLLRQVFAQQDTMDLTSLNEGGKRDARTFLQQLEGMTPYVLARVVLNSLGGHAFPLNESILTMLRAEEAIDPQADAADVQAFLERQIPARRMQKVWALLGLYAEDYPARKQAARKKTAAGAAVKEKKSRRASKKKETEA